MLPDGTFAKIVDVLRPLQLWLFGSRARRTSEPDSDWDVLVVLADGAATDLDDATWGALRDVRQAGVELVITTRDDFTAERDIAGTFAHAIASEGRVLYER